MENWNNLKDWQAWLNNISEPEWAAFMAQHGGEMDALRGAWAKFMAQRVLGQPENGVDDLSQRQPENDVNNSSQTQPENAVSNETKRQPESIRQPENAQTAVQQNQAVNNTALSNQSTQPDNTISGCLSDADLPSANIQAESTEPAASEVATAAVPAKPLNQAQSTLRQPENGTDNLPQTQPENTVSDETKQQPENIRQPENPQTAVPQNQTANNAAPGNQPIQPDNTVSGCLSDTDLPSANIQAQAEQVANEVATSTVPAQPSNQTQNRTPNQVQSTLRQPENRVTGEIQTQPENAVNNETKRQPENNADNPPQTQPENIKQPQIPQSPLQHPHPSIPMPTPHTFPPLPNARCGEPYRADFPLPLNATNITFEPECGLTWDAAAQQIHGTPSQSGDIEIRYEIEENGNSTVHRLQLYINPNPRDLWQTIDSDPNAPFAKPDTAHDLIATTQGRLIAARVRGRSHAHNGTHCDDDYRIAHHERTGLHFIAVADGAGSAEFSRYGSQLAVNAAANTVWQLLDNNEKFFRLPESEPKDQKHALENLISNAAYQAFVAQKNAAETEQIDIKKLACTLLIALALPRADGTWLITAYWVGDGAAAVWQPESQTITLLGESDGGAYSGETVFLSVNEVRPENLSKRIREWQGQQPPVLMLMTDGVSDPKFETDANLAKGEKWAALWQELQPIFQAEQPAAALEEWLDFWSPGNHDDRTLALFLPTKAA